MTNTSNTDKKQDKTHTTERGTERKHKKTRRNTPEGSHNTQRNTNTPNIRNNYILITNTDNKEHTKMIKRRHAQTTTNNNHKDVTRQRTIIKRMRIILITRCNIKQQVTHLHLTNIMQTTNNIRNNHDRNTTHDEHITNNTRTLIIII